MVSPNKKLKEYLNKSVRKLKHRKGYGVHSPFAYSIITEVIEEKLPYYAYRRMQRSYDKQAPVSYKVACLILRLANRFRCRNVAELGCDGGYSMLPLLLTDSRLHITTLASDSLQSQIATRLSWIKNRLVNIGYQPTLEAFNECSPFDMIIVNANPFMSNAVSSSPEQREASTAQLIDWLFAHVQENTLILVKGIQPKQRHEVLWDALCDREDISITMDLYDYGLAILKPRFFKQHYIVAF